LTGEAERKGDGKGTITSSSNFPFPHTREDQREQVKAEIRSLGWMHDA